MSCHIILYITSYNTISYIMSCHIISYIIYYIISHHIIYHVMSCHIIYHVSYHIISYHTIYHISYHIPRSATSVFYRCKEAPSSFVSFENETEHVLCICHFLHTTVLYLSDVTVPLAVYPDTIASASSRTVSLGNMTAVSFLFGNQLIVITVLAQSYPKRNECVCDVYTRARTVQLSLATAN